MGDFARIIKVILYLTLTSATVFVYKKLEAIGLAPSGISDMLMCIFTVLGVFVQGHAN